MRALIDGDIVVYKCGFAAQHRYYAIYAEAVEEGSFIASFRYKKEADEWMKSFPNEKFVVKDFLNIEPLSHALHNVNELINRIKADVQTQDINVFISGEDSFRKNIYPEYKANRDPTHKPFWLKEIKTFLENQYKAIVTEEGKEADDYLGIYQTDSTCICTIDKDLNMIPGWHYHLDTRQIYHVGTLQALRTFYKQILTGDPVDNIPGLYSLRGIKCTRKIMSLIDKMNTAEEMEAYCRGLYKNNTQFDLNKQLIRILTNENNSI